MMWDDGGWGVGGWIATSVMMLVFWGGLIALVVLIVRASLGDQARDGTTRGQDADEVLAERFARGEIDEDEFARRREVLHSGMKHSSQ